MRSFLLALIIMMITSCNSNTDSKTVRTDTIVNENTVEVNKTRTAQKALI